MKKLNAALALAAMMGASPVHATDLEVTHWWTSGGEAAAVAELAKAFDNDGQGDHWVDGAIAGSTDVARPLIVSRILGGNPMGATQLNTGRDAEDLVKAGLMLDITDAMDEIGLTDFVRPKKILSACEYDGKRYCVTINLHSWQWLWLNRHVFEDNGMTVPTNWDEFVATFPTLKQKGIVPLALAQGWPIDGVFPVLLAGIGGKDLYLKVYRDKNVEAVKSSEFRKVLQGYADVRAATNPDTIVGQWNEATNMVITGKAAGQIMGDWAQGEFQVAGKVAGQDYDCLPGLGVNPVLDIGGDSFYFPKQDDPAITAAQKRLAKLIVSPAVQVAFNLKKGSLPIRGDVDLSQANACMKKGLKILENPDNVLPGGEQTLSSDTQGQIQDVLREFFANPNMGVDELQGQFADIVANAD